MITAALNSFCPGAVVSSYRGGGEGERDGRGAGGDHHGLQRGSHRLPDPTQVGSLKGLSLMRWEGRLHDSSIELWLW
jgi:hypothetical protein